MSFAKNLKNLTFKPWTARPNLVNVTFNPYIFKLIKCNFNLQGVQQPLLVGFGQMPKGLKITSNSMNTKLGKIHNLFIS